jgi:subtilisin family serine protease
MKTKKIAKTKYESSDSVPTVRRRGLFFGTVLMGIMVAVATLPERVFSAPAAATFRADRILVKPKEGIPLTLLTNLNTYLGSRILHTFPHIGNLQVINLPKFVNVSNAIAFFQRSGLVKYAEPDYYVSVLNMPDDFYFQQGNQWNLINVGQFGGTPGADIDATNAWDIQTSASNVIVAVVDTGIRYTHEDLAPNLWHNPQENTDGYTNDLYGINLVDNGRGNGDPWDDYGHGSHVAGIIGAAGNNGVGIAGICWNVQLMALKFIDTNGNGTISDAITCMDFARSHGAKIVNASWGSPDFRSVALYDAINSLRDAGILFVAAAGNSGENNDGPNALFPASYSTSLDNVIAVAGTDWHDNMPSWSNYGQNSVQLAAPADPIFSCWNGSDSDYEYDAGSSMAAAHVSGACALVWGEYPNLTALQVMKHVLDGVDLVPGLANKCETGGRLNLFKALMPLPVPQPPPATNVWVDDSLPGGAESTSTVVTNYDANGNVEWIEEPWNWVANNPMPFSGAAADQSASFTGIHRQSFAYATNTLPIYSGDNLFAYVYLDPNDPPNEIMIEWNDGCWEHRAFWGENDIPWGQYGTSDRLDMGDLPPAGQWVRLEVPASALKLEGAALQGMSFMLYGGRATWDYAGRSAAGYPPP